MHQNKSKAAVDSRLFNPMAQMVRQSVRSANIGVALKAAFESSWLEKINNGADVEDILTDLDAVELDIQELRSRLISKAGQLMEGAQRDLKRFDDSKAAKEGWGIVDCGDHSDGRYQLQRIDENGVFDSDYDAQQFVLEQAKNGSELHLKAINIIAQ